jgi:hypothetical protein
MRVWLTSEYDHDGLRADGARILTRLLELARGRRLISLGHTAGWCRFLPGSFV